LNERKNRLLNAGEPSFLRLGSYIGKITEGTLGRMSSTVANYALRSDGGGVLFNCNKLAEITYSKHRATDFGKAKVKSKKAKKV
jgi:hypothetical protein